MARTQTLKTTRPTNFVNKWEGPYGKEDYQRCSKEQCCGGELSRSPISKRTLDMFSREYRLGTHADAVVMRRSVFKNPDAATAMPIDMPRMRKDTAALKRHFRLMQEQLAKLRNDICDTQTGQAFKLQELALAK